MWMHIHPTKNDQLGKVYAPPCVMLGGDVNDRPDVSVLVDMYAFLTRGLS